MGKARIATGVLLVTLVTAAMGYTIASAVLTYQDLGFGAKIDFAYIAQNYLAILDRRPEDAQLIHLIIGSFAAAGMMLSLALSGSALTRFGQTHWQSAREMKANGFFGAPGTGFILGKLGSPKSRAKYICSKVFPHALIVAPTGRGKTTGFVIPNLLTWQGSAVTLDVKGECFEATARHRAAHGDKVYRFAPTDWEGKRTHRYNPLLRIYQLKDPARQQMELQLLATLFLQSDNDRVQGLLKGGIDLFVAAGLLAFQRKRPTLGEIYRIAASGGNKQKEYFARGHEVDNSAAKLIFARLASTNNDTLTSYVSLLMTSGLDQWQNPAIDEATAVSDFDFRTIRKKPFSVYLVVQPLMVKSLAPLIRLFFSDLLSAMQERDPGPDEPWPVMIMLDEFNRLGKMPIVVESIETLRTYRGHLAVVTQTIPALDEIYGENTRRALQGNAGVKLYLTPSDEKTVEELSKAVGKSTKTVVTRSRSIGKNPFEGRNESIRTEETSLLPEDEARRLPLDEIVMVIDAQMPIRAKRIQYFNDRFLKTIHDEQIGEQPLPQPGGIGSQDNLSVGVQAIPLFERSDRGTDQKPYVASAGPARGDTRLNQPKYDGATTNKAEGVVLAVPEEEQRQLELDFEGQESSEDLAVEVGDKRVGIAVNDLGELESLMKRGQ
ncbi:type IV secretory system conjugative DNA transfer family protein [uncultured Roseobacter sp.]|uniref:type IV secretory system conjugative DNA transfer family protein n=1 Tax=uncultured Roseobacter sp. TaxID=114847 RepID=UPI002623620A|nr:type IV secretory system conjugative DNA transfer family protein [uncultured Roseobacter sp.]